MYIGREEEGNVFGYINFSIICNVIDQISWFEYRFFDIWYYFTSFIYRNSLSIERKVSYWFVEICEKIDKGWYGDYRITDNYFGLEYTF